MIPTAKPYRTKQQNKRNEIEKEVDPKSRQESDGEENRPIRWLEHARHNDNDKQKISRTTIFDCK